jgi:hypothetical protein
MNTNTPIKGAMPHAYLSSLVKGQRGKGWILKFQSAVFHPFGAVDTTPVFFCGLLKFRANEAPRHVFIYDFGLN